MLQRVGILLVLLAVAGVCFARLAAEPRALLVDGEHPGVDDQERHGERVVGNDLTRLFLPHHLRITREVAARGRFAAWDAFAFGGRPRVGNPQAGLWYPPVWLVWWSGAPAALGWLTVAHLVWGGLGTYRLVRTLGAGRWPAVVAGGCYQATPYLLAQAFEGHLPHVWAASWYPWAFWAALAVRGGRWHGLALLPLILALCSLTGHPQEWYYLVFALGAWVAGELSLSVLRAWSLRRARRLEQTRSAPGPAAWTVHRAAGLPWWPRLALWGGVLGLSVGLAAVELVPDLKARAWMPQGGRLLLKHASHYHLNPLNLVQLLSPFALGGPAEHFGHNNYWETLLSAGWVPLVLAAVAVARSPRRGCVRAWAALVGLSVVFAAGRRLGLFALAFELVPGMDAFRVPARALFLASLGAAVLAGLGVEAIARAVEGPPAGWSACARRHGRVVSLVVAGLVAGVVLGGGRASAPGLAIASTARATGEAARWARAAHRLTHERTFWLALAGTSAALAWLGRRPQAGARVAAALGLLALVELSAYGHGLLRTAPVGQFLGPDAVGTAITLARPAGAFRIRVRDAFYSDLRAARLGLEKTNANDFYQVAHAAALYEQVYTILGPNPLRGSALPEAMGIAFVWRAEGQAVLDRMNVALLVTDRPEREFAWPIAASGSQAGRPFWVYRNPTALPRAYVVPRAEPAPDSAAALPRFLTSHPRQAVLMAADPLADTPAGRQPFTPADYDGTDPDHVIVTAATTAPGLLVVADTWMPGWTATLDGRPVPILRGNVAQRVVALPGPGRHRVELRYEPPGLRLGLAITGLSLAAWMLGVLTLALRRTFARVRLATDVPRRPERLRVANRLS